MENLVAILDSSPTVLVFIGRQQSAMWRSCSWRRCHNQTTTTSARPVPGRGKCSFFVFLGQKLGENQDVNMGGFLIFLLDLWVFYRFKSVLLVEHVFFPSQNMASSRSRCNNLTCRAPMVSPWRVLTIGRWDGNLEHGNLRPKMSHKAKPIHPSITIR